MKLTKQQLIKYYRLKYYRLSTGEWLPSAIAVLFGEVKANPDKAKENSLEALKLAEKFADSSFIKRLTDYYEEYEAYLIDLDRKEPEVTLTGFVGWLSYYKLKK